MFLSAFITYMISIIFTNIKTKYISSKPNQQFDDNNFNNNIKILQFILKKCVRSSLVIYLITVIVSKIRFKQHQKKKREI